MKRYGYLSSMILLVLFLVGCQASEEGIEAGGEFETVTFEVDGMTCGGCVMKVENALKTAKGVKSCKVDLQGKKAVCIFDKTETTKEKLTEATKGTQFTLTLAN